MGKNLILEVPVNIDMIAQARIMSEEMGIIKNSIMQGGGNIYGFLGELLVAEYLKVPLKHSYDYDMELINGQTVDVKTKSTNWTPKLEYDCSIAAFNIKQRCDYYFFCRVKKDMTVGWLLGYMPKKEYFDKAMKIKKGDLDPANNFTAKSDMYNIKIDALYEPEALLKIVLDSTAKKL